MDDNLYDEFGNYIGPDIPELEDSLSEGEEGPLSQENDDEEFTTKPIIVNNILTQKKENYGIVLHEDKNYYPDVDEIFPGVEALVMEEDTQPITEPMVAPIITKNFDIIEKKIPDTNFEFDFLAGLMTKPELIRNVYKY
jgi:U5 small nuclear ribonucleoprotein component